MKVLARGDGILVERGLTLVVVLWKRTFNFQTTVDSGGPVYWRYGAMRDLEERGREVPCLKIQTWGTQLVHFSSWRPGPPARRKG